MCLTALHTNWYYTVSPAPSDEKCQVISCHPEEGFLLLPDSDFLVRGTISLEEGFVLLADSNPC